MIVEEHEPQKRYKIIREGLLEAISNSGDFVCIGQVYDAINRGEWTLFTFWDEREYVGFGIVELLNSANGAWLNVPFAYSKCNMYNEFFSQLSEIALDKGCSGVKFISSRPGFERRAKEFGWQKGFQEWIVYDLR